ncbi:4-(cytidine 5'-diphospho)-2-C-methyl-D-erythritol kinase [Nocardioides sp.]|uniref:4-(cytidine 5'-diphospho)-2-C-methyl-D-erythritol kinase n=1 Tax=Nocardioides sp. TaxID=35761 RepID=UPI002635BA02|nr:4-(cytidine 5'-diphospho)-2-C-methyl-D-erythritol kinase [Nocardioides sp.]
MSLAPTSEGVAVTVRAPAKINLHLGVGPVRADGFHPLVTVYQAIGLYDDVTATPAAPGAAWTIHTVADAHIDLATVPTDADNIAIRAGRALVAHHGRPDLAAHLEIHKGIPVAGGMAGGSADAAAALVAIDRLFDLQTSDDDLLALAADLGSDVPFALIGATALGTGRGELVDPVADASTLWWLVVPHEVGLSTPVVYRHFDTMAEAGMLSPVPPVVPEPLLAALADGDAAGVAAALHNDLAVPAYDLRPDLVALRDQIVEVARPDAVLLSGSGPTLLALVSGVEAARAAASRLTEAGITHWLAPAPVAGAHVVEIL